MKAADAPTKAGKPSDEPEKAKGVRKHLLALGAADESRSWPNVPFFFSLTQKERRTRRTKTN